MQKCSTSTLAKLLEDDDPHTLQLLCDQMAEQPEQWHSKLEALSRRKNPKISQSAKCLLRELNRRGLENDFELLCRFFSEDGNLEDACWLLNKAINPDADVESAKNLLNRWGHDLLLRISYVQDARKRIAILGNYFHKELGFQGNLNDYYNPSNSLLADVIQTRKGLPITLTCLVIFLSHRAGINVVGVNLPGHFIACHSDIFFDPYHSCRILSMDDCIQILLGQGILPTQDCFSIATPLKTLRRILTNLHFVYSKQSNFNMLSKVTAWLVALQR
ncbi:MAG: transglutaminase-like domain-containing protein [Chthoniobacterales bacterium]|nr:transglutaminase-like domain-containing protein [Chthoniobacterales bacterium]